jgi:hypothetical protein
MKFDSYRDSTGFDSKSEIERAKLLAVFKSLREGQPQFSAGTMASWFTEVGLAAPNRWRLDRALRGSRAFIRADEKRFRVAAGTLREFREKFPEMASSDENVEVTSEDILPAPLYEGSRGYIESLGRQINRSYAEKLFDGCAVLMRRLLEILVILAFRAQGEEAAIEKNGVKASLEKILEAAKASPSLKLSRNTRGALDDFRTLGNFAAHRIEYTTRRADIDKVRLEYRGAIEELLYKAQVRT